MFKKMEDQSYADIKARDRGVNTISIIAIHEERIQDNKKSTEKDLFFLRVVLCSAFLLMFIGFTVNALCEPLSHNLDHNWMESTSIVFLDLIVMAISAFGFYAFLWCPKKKNVKWNLGLHTVLFVLISIASISVAFPWIVGKRYPSNIGMESSTMDGETSNDRSFVDGPFEYTSQSGVDFPDSENLPKFDVTYFSFKDNVYVIPHALIWISAIVVFLHLMLVIALAYYLIEMRRYERFLIAEQETIFQLKSNLETPTEKGSVMDKTDPAEGGFRKLHSSKTSRRNRKKNSKTRSKIQIKKQWHVKSAVKPSTPKSNDKNNRKANYKKANNVKTLSPAKKDMNQNSSKKKVVR